MILNFFYFILSNCNRSLTGNSASIIFPDHSHIAFLAPAFSPRILHYPVFSLVFDAESDAPDRVIEGGWIAFFLVVDSTAVNLEGPFVSVNANRHRAILLTLSCEVILVTLSNWEVTADKTVFRVLVELTIFHNGGINVILFEAEFAIHFVNNVRNGNIGIATAASEAHENTVNEALLR